MESRVVIGEVDEDGVWESQMVERGVVLELPGGGIKCVGGGTEGGGVLEWPGDGIKSVGENVEGGGVLEGQMVE